MKKIIILFIFSLTIFSCNKKNLAISSNDDCIIKNEQTFVRISENILFDVYGEDNIIKQKPYLVRNVNDTIWTMTGSIQTDLGGVFYLEMNCKNAQVLKIEHTK
jgi:NTF2 fold immunity protein